MISVANERSEKPRQYITELIVFSSKGEKFQLSRSSQPSHQKAITVIITMFFQCRSTVGYYSKSYVHRFIGLSLFTDLINGRQM